VLPSWRIVGTLVGRDDNHGLAAEGVVDEHGGADKGQGEQAETARHQRGNWHRKHGTPFRGLFQTERCIEIIYCHGKLLANRASRLSIHSR